MIARALNIALLLVCIGLWSSPAALGADLQAGDQESARLLEKATDFFRQGTSAMQSDPARAADLLRTSAAAFEQLVREGGTRNARMFYNLGNAYLLLGETGRAVLNYRRAMELNADDPNLRANYAEARSRVATSIDAEAGAKVRQALFFWLDGMTGQSRLRWALGAYLAAWLFALIGMFVSARRAWFIAAALAGVVSIVMWASLWLEHRDRSAAPEAVIVSERARGYKGPDADAYVPSFTEPLSGGVEIRITERRPGWVLARLADGRETWLAENDVETVELPRPGG